MIIDARAFLVYGYLFMEIVWDEHKRQRNLAKHGLDFTALTEGFFEAAAIFPAKKIDLSRLALWMEKSSSR